jgi:hypothetical protein
LDKKHNLLLKVLLVGFLLLAIGQIMLYKQQAFLNQMISEGLMQLKENEKQVVITPAK